MDYEAQQLQEIEALQAIYQEDELELLCVHYPDISLRVKPKSVQNEECDSGLRVALLIELPSNYPDVMPRITLEGIDHIFTTDRIQEAVEKLESEARVNLGMVMIFSIVSALQEEIGLLLEEKKKELEMKVDEEKEKAEAIERRKFEGTIVTPESFRIWKEKFDKERKALMEKKEKEREASLAGKLTGKQLFLKDATLNLSDVALLEQDVEIDESLFIEEIDGLDLDFDDD